MQLQKIKERQIEFQRLVGFPIDSKLETDRNELSEKYVFKLIEEAIELRKEFPSIMNPWSKKNKPADLSRIKEEMSDVLLFFINLLITWRIDFEDLLKVAQGVQDVNFYKVKEKKLAMLNQRILDIPGYTSGIGQGSLNPKYVFLGMNPGKSIEHGYKVWSNSEDGSSKILLPVLEKLGILDDCYFTNIVKSTTTDNREPSKELLDFWVPFFLEELFILEADNPGVKIITMGKYVTENYQGPEVSGSIAHPASLLYGNLDKDQYEQQIRTAISSNN